MKEATIGLDQRSGRTKPRKANNCSDFVDPTSGRVTTQTTREGEMKYQLDGQDVSFEDGFSLSVGREVIPPLPGLINFLRIYSYARSPNFLIFSFDINNTS